MPTPTPITTTQARANALLLASRASGRAKARLAASPASTTVRELAGDVVNLSEMVELLCAALVEAEFRRP